MRVQDRVDRVLQDSYPVPSLTRDVGARCAVAPLRDPSQAPLRAVRSRRVWSFSPFLPNNGGRISCMICLLVDSSSPDAYTVTSPSILYVIIKHFLVNKLNKNAQVVCVKQTFIHEPVVHIQYNVHNIMKRETYCKTAPTSVSFSRGRSTTRWNFNSSRRCFAKK